jgi:endonuclease-3 related protein
MARLDASFGAIVTALARHYGLPAAAAKPEPELFPALVEVLLARASDPGKAERACRALAEAGLLDPRTLAETDRAEIDDSLRSAGIKLPPRGLAPMQRLARWFATREGGSATADDLARVSTESLRAELAALNGIGPATADALLLLGLGRPVYPVDRATYRILVRHGWLDLSADYEEARAAVERLAPADAASLARLADGFARVGREFCRVSAPRCDRCPLRPFLPEGGPIEPQMSGDED